MIDRLVLININIIIILRFIFGNPNKIKDDENGTNIELKKIPVNKIKNKNT